MNRPNTSLANSRDSFSWNTSYQPWTPPDAKQDPFGLDTIEWQEFDQRRKRRGRGVKTEHSSKFSLFTNTSPAEFADRLTEDDSARPDEVSDNISQATPAESSRASELQELREKAESYEKYKSLFRRVIGKVARSKGFRKVARAVATFSMLFALASCEAGVAAQPQESAAVDFIDEIEHGTDANSSSVDLDNIPSGEQGQVNLDSLPSDEGVNLNSLPSDEKVDLDNLPGDQKTNTSESESSQETKGIFNGYNKKGMWLSSNKGGAYDFASAVEVAEACNDDECDMVKYAAANQVECFADYLANLPEALQPEGFKGLTILDAEHKLESLSVDEFEAIKEKFNQIIDAAFTRDVTLDGYYHNAYMRLKDPSGPATHDNMELVECITSEEGTKAIELYFTDDGTANGNIIGSITIKISRENGNITGGCLQVVNAIEESARVYSDLITVAENPTPEPTPTPEETPDEPAPEPEKTPDDTPDEYIESKDAYNLTVIDNNIEGDIEANIGGSDVINHDDLGIGDITDQPDAEDYEGTQATIVESDTAAAAEELPQEYVTSDNDYTVDLDGAHSDEYAPVQSDESADAAAAQEEIPISEATVDGEALDEVLNELEAQ